MLSARYSRRAAIYIRSLHHLYSSASSSTPLLSVQARVGLSSNPCSLRTMATSVHPVSSSAEASKATQPTHPLPDVTSPHDTAPPPPVAGEPKQAKQQATKGQPKEKKDKKAGGGGSGAGPLELSPPPEYFQERVKIFDEYMEKYKKSIAGASRRSPC